MKKIFLILAIFAMTVVSVQAASLTVKWIASTDPEVTGYKLFYDVIDPKYSTGATEIDVGNVTEYIVTGLAPGTTYFFRGRAYSLTGESNWSNGAFGESELLPMSEVQVE